MTTALPFWDREDEGCETAPRICECGKVCVSHLDTDCDDCWHTRREWDARKATLLLADRGERQCIICRCDVVGHHAFGCTDDCGCPGFKSNASAEVAS